MERTQTICWVSPRWLHLTPPDFLLPGYFKDAVYGTKPATLKKSSGKRLDGLAQSFQQQLWWPLVIQLFQCQWAVHVVVTDDNTGKLCMLDIVESDFKRVTKTGTVTGEESTSWSGSIYFYISGCRVSVHTICRTLIANRVWSIWVAVWDKRLFTIQWEVYFANALPAILHRRRNKSKLVRLLNMTYHEELWRWNTRTKEGMTLPTDTVSVLCTVCE